MLLGLSIVALLLTLHDALFTQRRMTKYGPQVELNGLVCYLISNGCGLVTSVAVGVVLPSIAIVISTDALEWDHVLAFYVGLRSYLALSQIKSLKFEKIIDEIRSKQIRQRESILPPMPPVSGQSSSKSGQISVDPQGEHEGHE